MMMTCVGIAVKAISKEVKHFQTKKTTKGKTLIGVPYQGFIAVENIKQALIEDGVIAEQDVINYCSFLHDVPTCSVSN